MNLSQLSLSINKERLAEVKAKRLIEYEKEDSPEEIIMKYKTLLHARHDCFHILLAEMFELRANLGVEQKIQTMFPELKLENGRFTPDVVVVNGKDVKVFDITVTVSPETEAQSKKLKYAPLIEELNSKGYNTTLSVIAINNKFTNIEFAFAPTGFRPMSFGYFQTIMNVVQLIDTALQKIRVHVPSDALKREDVDYQTFSSELKTADEYLNVARQSELFCEKEYLTAEMVEQMFDELYDDPDVQTFLKDKVSTPQEFEKGFQKLDDIQPQVFCSAKPSFHFAWAPALAIDDTHKDCQLKPDQKHCLNILSIAGLHTEEKDQRTALCKSLYDALKQVVYDPDERRLFDTGFYTGSFETDLHEKFEKYSESLSEDVRREFKRAADFTLTGEGTRDFNIEIHKHLKKARLLQLRNQMERIIPPFAERAHQIKIGTLEQEAQSFKYKSGVNYKKHHSERQPLNEPTSCDPRNSAEMDKFIAMLSEDTAVRLKLDPLFDCPIGKDNNVNTSIKKKSRQLFTNFYKIISKVHAHNFSYHTMLAADQAMHFCTLATKESTFYFVNTGQPNVMHVFQGSTVNRSKDIGQPFFTIVITDDKRWSNSVFGNIKTYKIEGSEKYVLITGWRRLQIHKLMLLRDQYYSCLSTGFDTYSRNITSEVDKDFLDFVYIIKICVAGCTSQRVAEFLMDARYAIMACYSDFTNISSLIVEKFCAPYPNAFSHWLVKTLREKCKLISSLDKNSFFKIKQAAFLGESRLQSSIGGKLRFPGIWSNYNLTSLQDFFDELYIYCLTGKEPSSTFYEGIKSLKTIKKFQDEFDSLSLNEKQGIHTSQSFKKCLLNKNMVLFSRDAIYQGARKTSETMLTTKLKESLDKVTKTEVLSDVVSTKVCLPEYNLEIVESDKLMSSKTKTYIEQLGEQLKKTYQSVEPFKAPVQKLIVTNSETVVTAKSATNRVKVHDACYDMLCRFGTRMTTTLDVANWNIFENSNRVTAHICIKAQYGAKREFYVVNFGAKLMARVYENSFKEVAKCLDSEMISVPGDSKLSHMASKVNSVIRSSKNPDDLIYYVNGDCSKWSASDTMGAYWSLNDGFKDVFGGQLHAMNSAVISGWARKQICIPQDVLNGIHYITEITDYLRVYGLSLRSTQNFLQGMFNYSSSTKAVCATEFAIRQWRRRFGVSRPLICEHLEHSDDYGLIIRVNTVEDLIDFRIMHKLSQRLFGINDSDKKTNIQRVFMEFISLVCFNGQVSYPHIKKTKEVGTNIAGVGFQRDIMNSISRSSESLRVGAPTATAYIQQLIQNWSLYRKYSLAKGQRNYTISDPFNTPIDCFGLPDCVPIVYVGTVGDPNNYRLYKYCPDARILLRGMAYHTIMNRPEELHEEALVTFAQPEYYYPSTSRRLKEIRRIINYTPEQLTEKKLNYPEFSICKPREPQRFKEWLAMMYYNKSFAVAYTNVSRSQINLRLSHFSSGRCIGLPNQAKLYTLKEFISYWNQLITVYSTQFEDKEAIERMITNGDANIEAYFSYTEQGALVPQITPPLKQVISQLPQRFKFLNLENQLTTVIQYFIAPESIHQDRLFHRGFLSLERDMDKLRKLVQGEPKNPKTILSLHKLLKSQANHHTVALCYSIATSESYLEYLSSTLSNGLYYKESFKFFPGKVLTLHNPISGQEIHERNFAYTDDIHHLMLENLTLLAYLLIGKYNFDEDVIYNLLGDCKLIATDKPVKEELNNVTLDLSKGSLLFHKRMFAYFQATINNNFDALNHLAVSDYTIWKHYLTLQEQQDLQKRLKIDFEDAVTFRIKYTTFWAIKQKEDKVLVFCNYCSYTLALMSVVVAQRMFDIISQNQFEKIIKQGNLPYNLTTIRLNNDRKLKYKAYQIFGNVFDLRNVNQEDKYIPCVHNFQYRGFQFDDKQSITSTPEIGKLRVYSGSITLFKLPFWACSNVNVISYPNIELENGFNCTELSQGSLLYNYLRSREESVGNLELDLGRFANFFKNTIIDPKKFGLPGKEFIVNLTERRQPVNVLEPKIEYDYTNPSLVQTNRTASTATTQSTTRTLEIIENKVESEVIDPIDAFDFEHGEANNPTLTVTMDNKINSYNDAKADSSFENKVGESDLLSIGTYSEDDPFGGMFFEDNANKVIISEQSPAAEHTNHLEAVTQQISILGQYSEENPFGEDFLNMSSLSTAAFSTDMIKIYNTYEKNEFGESIELEEHRLDIIGPELTLDEEGIYDSDTPETNSESDSDIEPEQRFLQLNMSNIVANKQGFVEGWINKLPPLNIYMLRCWSQYSIVNSFSKIQNILIYFKMLDKLEPGDLEMKELIVIAYSYWELNNLVLCRNQFTPLQLNNGKEISFNEGIFSTKERFFFNFRRRAELKAERINGKIVRSRNGFEVIAEIPINQNILNYDVGELSGYGYAVNILKDIISCYL